MAHVLNDRVKETTTTTGTGTIDLDGAETGFESFVSAIGNSNSTYYAIAHSTLNEFEIGIGTVTDASPDTLSRTTVISSTNSDNLVDFSAGSKDVFCTLPASKAVFFDPSSGSSDVAIGSRGTNPLALGITGTVLAVSEASDVASVQIDGVTGTRIDMGTSGSRNAVFFTDATQLEIARTTDHPIKFKINANEIARLISTELKLASGKKLTGGATNVDFTIQSEHRIEFISANKGTVIFKDQGTAYALLERPTGTNDLDIQNPISDGDITFVGNDGGTGITALTLDMSDAGSAYFNNMVGIGTTTPDTDGYSYAEDLVIKAGASASDGAGLSINSVGREYGVISFLDSSSHAGEIFYQHTSDSLYFKTAAVNRWKLDSSGNMTVVGNVTAYGSVSDERLKENIEVIENPIEKIKGLKGVTFTYKKDGQESTGLIAQDLEKVLPEAVYTTKTIADEREGEESEEHLAIRYGNTVGLLVEAIKELEARVKELEGK